MGKFNQIYGYNINTPNFFSIAQDSTIFRNAHCAGPTCSPSRAALLTGMCPHSAGILGLAHRGFEISEPKRHLSWYLKNLGYQTALFGVQHEIKDVKKLGYDTVYDEKWEGDHDENITEKASDFILNYSNEKPFFISVGLFAPHRPYRNNPSDLQDFVLPPKELCDLPQVRKDYADYIESVAYADQCAGKVIDALKKRNMYDDMLVLLTTDHGVAFPFMKCNLTDSGTGVTMAMKLPHQKQHHISDQLISQIDVFPTLCDLLNSQKPDWLQGKSFMNILNGEKSEINDAIYSEVTYHAAYEPQRCIRTKRYKYIKRFDTYGKYVLPNIDAGYSKSCYLQYGLQNQTVPREELYDLVLDPMEKNNLASNDQYSDIKKQLESSLLKWQTETNDPLLDHFSKFKITGWYNPVDQIDPDEKNFIYGKDSQIVAIRQEK